ncbi:hypothetical protein ARMGADRAFT_812696 [Armillaria gallica]|uniref:Uncharacterized protein n=1 Tax=Armillaria gallica TaxID=47427 RepID=A0A2H3CH49_ARMGA|nr:hypothetical protein ARMGADRAFT_812696 [Armillaria gallica]
MSIFEQEVERDSLLAERRETRMAVESESRTWLSWESILSLTTLVANFWAQSPPRACFYSSSFSSGLFQWTRL